LFLDVRFVQEQRLRHKIPWMHRRHRLIRCHSLRSLITGAPRRCPVIVNIAIGSIWLR